MGYQGPLEGDTPARGVGVILDGVQELGDAAVPSVSGQQSRPLGLIGLVEADGEANLGQVRGQPPDVVCDADCADGYLPPANASLLYLADGRYDVLVVRQGLWVGTRRVKAKGLSRLLSCFVASPLLHKVMRGPHLPHPHEHYPV